MKLYSALYKEFHPFSSIFPDAEKIVVRGDDKLDEDGILIIWGGGDIHPSIYSRENKGSYITGDIPSPRDMSEMKLFITATKVGIPIIGVCRGAQLGCAMSGGFLVQDVTGHHADHRITNVKGETFLASSLHHQMMYPWDIDHELLAWSTHPRSVDYRGISDQEWKKWPRKIYEELKIEDVIEPEIVWFPKTKCLAVQGHPEAMPANCQHNNYLSKILYEQCALK